MTRPVDIQRLRRARERLDALREAHPELTQPEAQKRLHDALEAELKEELNAQRRGGDHRQSPRGDEGEG